MQAVILCGGQGTRLSSIYPDRPKALVPVAGKPFLEWQIDWLRKNSLLEICLAAGYKGDQIACWIRHRNYTPSIAVSVEPAPLGTGGGLRFIQTIDCRNSFWAFNGDSLLPQLNFKRMEQTHRSSGALATLAVTSTEDAARYGTIGFDADGKITRFQEKGRSGLGWINAGVYLLEPSVLSVIPAGKQVSIEREIFPLLAADGRLFVFKSEPPLLDMGTPDGLAAMEKYLNGSLS